MPEGVHIRGDISRRRIVNDTVLSLQPPRIGPSRPDLIRPRNDRTYALRSPAVEVADGPRFRTRRLRGHEPRHRARDAHSPRSVGWRAVRGSRPGPREAARARGPG